MIANRNKVFVRQLEAETATASGIVIPDSVQKKQKYGTIVRIDNYDKEKYGELSIGDTVSFSQYAGEPASVEQDLLVMHPGIFYSKIVDGKHQAIGSFVLVELEHKYQKTQVVGGVELLLDVPVYDKGTEVFFNKGQRLKYSGKVVSVPTTRQFDEQGYEIDTIIKEGDEAYFRFMNASDDSFEIGKSVSDYSELTTIRVPYEDVFCIVRDGQISTIGEWVLGEPFIDGGGQEIQMHINCCHATANRHLYF